MEYIRRRKTDLDPIEDALIIEKIKEKISEKKLLVTISSEKIKDQNMCLNLQDVCGIVTDYNDSTNEFTIKALRLEEYLEASENVTLNYLHDANFENIYIHSLGII